MANNTELKNAIAQVIKTNGNQEITGQVLQNTLNSIISSIGSNATFVGIAIPTTNPGTPDQNVFYFAVQAGTYVNFGGLEIKGGFNIIKNNASGNWVLSNVYELVGELGDSETAVINQKAVSTELVQLRSDLINEDGMKNIPLTWENGGLNVTVGQEVTKNSSASALATRKRCSIALTEDTLIQIHNDYDCRFYIVDSNNILLQKYDNIDAKIITLKAGIYWFVFLPVQDWNITDTNANDYVSAKYITDIAASIKESESYKGSIGTNENLINIEWIRGSFTATNGKNIVISTNETSLLTRRYATYRSINSTKITVASGYTATFIRLDDNDSKVIGTELEVSGETKILSKGNFAAIFKNNSNNKIVGGNIQDYVQLYDLKDFVSEETFINVEKTGLIKVELGWVKGGFNTDINYLPTDNSSTRAYRSIIVELKAGSIITCNSNYKLNVAKIVDGNVASTYWFYDGDIIQSDGTYRIMLRAMNDAELNYIYADSIANISYRCIGNNISDNEVKSTLTWSSEKINQKFNESGLDLNNFKNLFVNVICIGDSLTRGGYYDTLSGWPIVENYPYYLKRLTGWNVTMDAVGGYNPKQWYEHFAGSRDWSVFDTVCLWLGENGGLTDTVNEDTASGNPETYADTSTGYYCRIVEMLINAKDDINIFVGTIHRNNDQVSNGVIRQIATKYSSNIRGVVDLDDGTLWGGDIQNLYHPFNNDVHFGKIGNLHLASHWVNSMCSIVAANEATFEILCLGKQENADGNVSIPSSNNI